MSGTGNSDKNIVEAHIYTKELKGGYRFKLQPTDRDVYNHMDNINGRPLYIKTVHHDCWVNDIEGTKEGIKLHKLRVKDWSGK